MELARSARPRFTLAAALAALVVAGAVLVTSTFGSHAAPPGQPALAPIGSGMSAFGADFDAACDQVRILVLLSPT